MRPKPALFAVAELLGHIGYDRRQAWTGAAHIQGDPDMCIECLAIAQMPAGLHHRTHHTNCRLRSQELGEQWNVSFDRFAFRRTMRKSQQPPSRFIRPGDLDRKSTRLNSSHLGISYAVFCL